MYGDIRVFDRHGNFLFVTDDRRVLGHKWHKLGKGYAATCINGKQVTAHRFISDCPEGLVVDHIDRDRANNRKSNLRVCSQSENIINAKTRCTNSSGYKGVYFNKVNRKWIAQACKNYKVFYIGSFDTKEEAAQARLDAGFQIG